MACECTKAFVCIDCIQNDPARPQWKRKDGASRASAAEQLREWREHGGKYCPSCQETKPMAEFWRNRANRDGLQSRCSACIKRVRYGVRKPCPTCGSAVYEYLLEK